MGLHPVGAAGAGRGKGGWRSNRIMRAKGARAAAAEEWAAGAASRPYSMSDLAHADGERATSARKWWESQSFEDLRSECFNHKLGYGKQLAKYKLVNSLVAKAQEIRQRGTPAPAAPAASASASAAAAASACAYSAPSVRASLASDLRAGFKYNKKMKKGGNMMLRASFLCRAGEDLSDLFAQVFPAAAAAPNGKGKAKTRVAIDESALGLAPLRKMLRYGAELLVLPGSMNARVDALGIHVGCKMRMDR
eukprot:g2950.t1